MNTISVGDIVIDKTDHPINKEYDGTKRLWRVDAYLKPAVKPNFNNVFEEIIFGASQECGPDNCRLQWCSQDEAVYLSLYGVCGHTARVSDCEVVGRVNWPEKRIAEAKQSAERLIGQIIF